MFGKPAGYYWLLAPTCGRPLPEIMLRITSGRFGAIQLFRPAGREQTDAIMAGLNAVTGSTFEPGRRSSSFPRGSGGTCRRTAMRCRHADGSETDRAVWTCAVYRGARGVHAYVMYVWRLWGHRAAAFTEPGRPQDL